jgi:primosomal protein N' (replication factor Y)
VGIINADTGLFLPDFRSGEKVFQLIYQAAGRAGRGATPGEVVVQTFNPENEIIKDAVNYDLTGYYKKCLNERSDLNYPPFSWLVRLEIRGKNKNDVARSIENLNRKIISLPIGIEKLGPSPCYREKLKDNYRMQIVLKSDKKYDSTGSIVHNIYKNAIKNSNLRKNTYGPKLIVDVNPISLL